MPLIKNVTFYFAMPMTDSDGNPVYSDTPESHTLTWQQITENVGFSLSTGEAMFTELPNPENDHIIRLINGFYFGSGKYGSLLAIQYKYDDDSEGWISQVIAKSSNSENLDMLVGSWIKGLSYEEIIEREEWTGQPYIGLADDYIEVEIKRQLPDIVLNLEPENSIITEGESVTFEFSSIDYCDGDMHYEWIFDQTIIRSLTLTDTQHIIQFNEPGIHQIELRASNDCGQTASKIVSVVVNEKEEDEGYLILSPDVITIRLGETATFTAVHPYSETGTWILDALSLDVVERTSKIITVKPKALGSYSISYKVNDLQANALLFVLDPPPEEEWEDPVEPPPPPLPDTPPETGGRPGLIVDLADASIPEPPLYKYPNTMKRNARYRGHRESEKVLHDHQEQIYDIRQSYRDIMFLEEMKDITTHSWFHGAENVSIFSKGVEIKTNSNKNIKISSENAVDTERGFNNDVVQLNTSDSTIKGRMAGIYSIKQRMQSLDERIAEAERRYREYENAYE